MLLEEKKLTAGFGPDGAKAGERTKVEVDYCLINDAYSHRSIDFLAEGEPLFDSGKVAVIIDHDTPSGSETASEIQRKLINFAQKHATIFHHGEGVGYQILLDRYVEAGQIIAGCGEHVSVFGAVGAIGLKVEPEELAEILKTGIWEMKSPEWVRIILSGQLPSESTAKDLILHIIHKLGTDELSGKMIEFSGEALSSLTVNDRITLCNLAGKANGTGCVINSVLAFAREGCRSEYEFDLSMIKPMAAKPDSFEKIVEISGAGIVPVNEVFIGGCSSGRIEDLRIAADIVRGKKVARGLRMMIAPVTSAVYVQALREGLIGDFIDAGAIVMNQGCSVCWGKSQGLLDAGEVLVSGGSYNHKGCTGSKEAKVYVTSAATAAASAVTGLLSEAKDVCGGM